MRYCRGARARVPRRLVERRHEARAHPRRDPAAPPPPASRGRARTCSRSPTSGRGFRRELERTLVELLVVDRRDRSAPISAAVSARCASTTRCASRDASAFGPWRIESDAARPRRAHAPAGRPPRGPDARRCRTSSWTRRCRARARDAWPLVVSGDDVVAVPGHRRGAWLGRRRPRMERCRRSDAGRAREGRRRDPHRGGRAAGAHRRARRRDLRRLRRAATFCSSASSRAPSSSWPTSCASSRSRARSTSWRSRATAPRPTPPASSASSRTSTSTSSGRDVLVVEDIIDSGLTLSYLMRNLRARKPASLEVVTLLTKPERREIDVPVPLRRLRDPESLRHRLRARLRRALPQPPVRRRPPSGPDPTRPLGPRAERHVARNRPTTGERGFGGGCRRRTVLPCDDRP